MAKVLAEVDLKYAEEGALQHEHVLSVHLLVLALQPRTHHLLSEQRVVPARHAIEGVSVLCGQ